MNVLDKVSEWFRSFRDQVKGRVSSYSKRKSDNRGSDVPENENVRPSQNDGANMNGGNPQVVQGQQGVYPPQGYPQGAYAQPPQQEAAYPAQEAGSNVLNFPRQKSVQEEAAYYHYIMLLHSREECKNVIAYIKNNASVFVNIEYVSGENERQRIVDVLSGAAYTLGCTITRISSRGIYLISSPRVRVIMDESTNMQSGMPNMADFIRDYRTPSYPQGEPPRPQRPPVNPGIPFQGTLQSPHRLQRRGGTPTERFAATEYQRPPEMMNAYPAAQGMAQAD